MENFFDNKRILSSLIKWRIHIIVVAVIAVVGSVIISSPFIIKPKFKSVARIYPVNIADYSEESETEQMLEIIRSNDIKFMVIDAFKLDEVYKINRDDKYYTSYILSAFNDNVSFKKTEFETVEIKTLDENPQRASDIADSIIAFFSKKMQSLHSKKYFEIVEIARRDLELKNHEIDSISLVLNDLRKNYGLLDYGTQVSEATRGYITASVAGAGFQSKEAENMLNSLKEKGGEYMRLNGILNSYLSIADSLKVTYDWGLSNATKKITYAIVSEKPFPADKKSYPVRWLIILMSLLGAIAFSTLVAVTFDYYYDNISKEK